MEDALFLGIDGGQSSTIAWVGDSDGRVVATSQAGPCNHVGAEEGRRRFTSALRECLGTLPAPSDGFEAACLGFSGGPEDKEELVRTSLRAKQLLVTHDALIALSGATAGEPGVIVIAGTGSIAFGRNASGQTARAGGWGYVFGDEGGAFDLVRQALRASLRHEEGWGPPTVLRDNLLAATGAAGANELLHRFYTDAYSRDRVAAMAGLVGEAAKRGDGVALEILHQAGQHLAEFAGAVRQQLFGDGERPPASGVGGVFEDGYVRERFRSLVETAHGLSFTSPRYSPAGGALLEAYRLAGHPVDALLIETE